MRHLRKWQLAVVCLLALALLPFAPAPRGTAQAPGYTVTDLGTLGGDMSRAFGLDECGRVVGEAQAAAGASAPLRPFIWDGGTMTDLGTLGGPGGTAKALNRSGTVVGSALTSASLRHPFVRYEGAAMFDLDTLPRGFTAEAYDVNALGQVVGVSEEGATLQDRACIWNDFNGNQANDPGEQQPLSATWGTPIRAHGINDAGQVTGNANVNGTIETHAFLTIGGVAIDLGTLGGAVSFGYDVNDSGEVVGRSYIPIPPNTITQSFHAFRWRDANANGQSDPGEMQDLGTLGGRNSYAYGMNDSGQVVGASEFQANNGATRAFVWSSATNVMQDLNAVVTGTNWTFEEARAVNDRGQIVGFGKNPQGKTRAFLLTPTNVGPSPCEATPTPSPTPSPTLVPGALQFTAAAYTVGEAGGSAVVSVSRTGDLLGAVSVNYATSDGTAAAGATGDYLAAGGTLNFASGETTKTFSVTVNDDALDEPDETVNLTLSGPGGGATLGAQAAAALTITDNEGQPTLQFGSATYSVAEGGTKAAITVTRSGGGNGGVTVNYATSNGTAAAGSDYTATSGTLTFAEGDDSETFNVPVANDALDEANKTVNLALSSPGGGAALGPQTTAVLTIADDDATPTLSITQGVTVVEGNTGSAPATTAAFAVTLDGASAQTVTVNYATVDVTAEEPGDYAAASGTVTFNPGETGSKTVNIAVFGDTADEPNETFVVALSSPSNATFAVTPGDTFGVGTITDDDGAPSLNINDVTVTEGNAGTTAATFTVLLLPASGQTVKVKYATADGTASAGSDYAATSGELTLAPGQTSKTVTVNVSGDATPEAYERFLVNLSDPTNATVVTGQGQGTINNDDAALSIKDVSLAEGHAGNKVFSFAVSLSHPTVNSVSVNYATADGTAAAGSDYAAVNSAALAFNPNETSRNVVVQVAGDSTFETDETFFVNLSGATNATISDAQGQGTILNDEGLSIFQFKGGPSYFVSEGAGAASITISRSNSTAGGAVVNYTTSAGGTATEGSDYTATSGTLTFAEGETEKSFTVALINNTLHEPRESVHLSFTPGFGGATGGGLAFLNINDDDDPPTFQLSQAAYTTDEDGVNNSGRINITVTRTGGTNPASVVYSTTSHGSATGNLDYGHIAAGALNFAEGETSKTFEVTIWGDGLDEPDETFGLSIGTGGGAVLGSPSTAVVTITDNDDPPTISIGDASAAEGNAGTHFVTFTVTLSYFSGKTVAVNYATSDGTAIAGRDYTALTPGTLTFAPGENTKTIMVPFEGDTLDEADKTFNVNLSNPTNAKVNDGTGVGTITDDDPPPGLSVNDVTVAEGNSGTTAVNFTVTLAPGSGRAVSVNYATADGTAAAGSDYAATSGALTFSVGETTKTVSVNVNGDTANEADETFSVILSGASNAVITDTHGQGAIQNDDTPTLRFSQATYPVGEGAHFVTVTVTRAGDPTPAVGVDFATGDGAATGRRDYTAVSGTLRFAAGETSKGFDVLLTEDSYQEPEETINLTLSNPTGGASLGSQSSATVNISADDSAQPQPNPIDDTANFVRQHYHDFLNREPDAAGLNFWVDDINLCGADAGCRDLKKINVSAAFFLSIEFQQTGYLVYRTYKAAYGDATSANVAGRVPVVRLQEFLPDTRRIGQGVVVGVAEWEQNLEANKDAYMAEFAQRQRFLAAFPASLTAAEFVDRLNQNAGGVLSQTERDQLVNELSANAKTRAQVLRAVAEHAALQQNEFRRAFVLMQFYGYLRRNPDDPQDTDFRGWKFWLDKLNDFNGNFQQAEMVKAFLESVEYRTRFAP